MMDTRAPNKAETRPTPGRMLRPLLGRGLRASPLWPLLRPRRIHAYCVGAAKSGTVSVCGMFSQHYRSGHEVAMLEVVEMMILRLAGRLPASAARRRLAARDRMRRLEMDSINQLAMFAGELAEMFPRARFVLTVREPRAWLGSILNQHLNVDVSNRPAERMLRQLLFQRPGTGYGRGEEELERMGLYPIAGYLGAWSAHYAQVLDAVPSDRLLVVTTAELAASVETIAAFLAIPPRTIDATRTHLHRAPRDHGVLGRLDPALVEESVERHCGPLWRRIEALK